MERGEHVNISPLLKQKTNKMIPTFPPEKEIKVYTVLLNQSTVNPPVPTILKNDMTEEIIWTRLASGQYQATMSEISTTNTAVFISPRGAPLYAFIENGYVEINAVQDGAPYDGLINEPFEIRIYNI